MKIFRALLLHICVVCSLVCIIAKILDWHNPFMDFTGHMGYIQLALYAGVLILAFTKTD